MALMALSAKELSLPLPLVDPRWRARICLFHFLERNHFASRMIIPVDTMRRNIFLENDVINQVKLTQINHIRKRKTSKRWIPSQRKEKVLTSSTSCNLLCYSPRNRLRAPSADGQRTLVSRFRINQ